jgi:aspartate aminotransferase
MVLAKRVSKLKPSPTLAIDAKAKAMISQGMDVVNFGVGEPDFDTPDNIKEAAIKAINNGFTKYTAVGGIDVLREAIVRKLKEDNNLIYSKNQIIVSCGAKHSLYNIAQVLFDRGDEVIIPAPYWVSYPDQVILNNAKPVIVDTSEDNNFMLNIKKLKKKITKKTKAIILNSPSNPTGSAYNKNILEEIAEIAVKKKIFIISDEIYEKIVYDGFKHISIASLNEKIKNLTIVVNGLSKSHSMTGWRIGYAAGPEEIISAMSKVQSQSTSNPTSISQKAAFEALTGPQDFTVMMVSEFDNRRRYIVKRLNKIDGITCRMPQGAFYVFPNVSKLFGRGYDGKKIRGSSDLSAYLLENAQTAVVSGDAFGADDYIRFSYATSMDAIRKGLDRIEDAIKALD